MDGRFISKARNFKVNQLIEVTLKALGWTSALAESFEENHQGGQLVPARVSRNSKQIYHVLCEDGEFVARVSGNFRHHARVPSDYPAVGDWVVVSIREEDGEADIHALLPRRTVFSRQAVSASGNGIAIAPTDRRHQCGCGFVSRRPRRQPRVQPAAPRALPYPRAQQWRPSRS